jgi:hypothetical protein
MIQQRSLSQQTEELVAMETVKDRANYWKTHRSWEDWAGIALSLSIILSPWMARQSSDPGVVMITALLGLMLLTLAQYELVKAHRSVELVELACGIAVMALPLLLGYSAAGQLRFWQFGLGGLVVSLALLELWQGWLNMAPIQTFATHPATHQPKSTQVDLH